MVLCYDELENHKTIKLHKSDLTLLSLMCNDLIINIGEMMSHGLLITCHDEAIIVSICT